MSQRDLQFRLSLIFSKMLALRRVMTVREVGMLKQISLVTLALNSFRVANYYFQKVAFRSEDHKTIFYYSELFTCPVL